jgi:hypothetical protein
VSDGEEDHAGKKVNEEVHQLKQDPNHLDIDLLGLVDLLLAPFDEVDHVEDDAKVGHVHQNLPNLSHIVTSALFRLLSKFLHDELGQVRPH